MEHYFDLNQQTYEWCVRLFDRVKSLLSVRIRLHHEEDQIESGDIFLFNHFARMETFVPQYLIYHENGSLCRSVAGAEFFKHDTRFSRLLRDLGVVPNNHPDLMLLLAADILRGRKVVIFPEGGMVKDRQVIDVEGRYSVYSRSSDSRRRHHTGAARLAIGLQILKLTVLRDQQTGNEQRLRRWAEHLQMASVDMLIDAARKPVAVVPANITFYPLRIDDNFLSRGADLMYSDLSPRAVEELIVEGNLFFKETDMDIRLGDPIVALDEFQWWERMAADFLAKRVEKPNDIYQAAFFQQNPLRRTALTGLRASISRLRDRYMRDIYQELTVNSSHVASRIIIQLIESGRLTVSMGALQTLVYRVIKRVQNDKSVHLHRSLCNPSIYRHLLSARSSEFDRFLDSAKAAGLIEIGDQVIRFLPKLTQEHEFDTVRLENPIEVYANEVAPIAGVTAAVDQVMMEDADISLREQALMDFDDELIRHSWDRLVFDKGKHEEINSRQTATEDAAPFLFESPNHRTAVLLVHGFLASPAEVRGFGELLYEDGYTVLGTRLRGHGTSPWDLRERSWQEWLDSVNEAWNVLDKLAEKIVLVGFSTGGTLSLLHAQTKPEGLAGVCAICPALKFQNKNMRFVPLMYGANRIVSWLSKYEGVMPFRQTEPEHPHINYRHMPIRGLYELTRLVSHARSKLSEIDCPVSIIQAENDPVVDPSSATIIYESLNTERKHLHWVPSNRHGILYQNIGDTHRLVHEFIKEVTHDSGTG